MTPHDSHQSKTIPHDPSTPGEHSYEVACARCGVSLMREGGGLRAAATLQCVAVKPFGSFVRFLAWVGLVRIRDGKVRWPFHVSPWRVWRANFWPAVGKREPIFAVFRNLPRVVKWQPGRLLPRRWGVRVLGFEFGDRG